MVFFSIIKSAQIQSEKLYEHTIRPLESKTERIKPEL